MVTDSEDSRKFSRSTTTNTTLRLAKSSNSPRPMLLLDPSSARKRRRRARRELQRSASEAMLRKMVRCLKVARRPRRVMRRLRSRPLMMEAMLLMQRLRSRPLIKEAMVRRARPPLQHSRSAFHTFGTGPCLVWISVRQVRSCGWGLRGVRAPQASLSELP